MNGLTKVTFMNKSTIAILLLTLIVIFGCSNPKTTDSQRIVENCFLKGEYDGVSYCSNNACEQGIPIDVASTCSLDAAKTLSKSNQVLAMSVCDDYFKVELAFYKKFHLDNGAIASINLNNCYKGIGYDDPQAEMICKVNNELDKRICIDTIKSLKSDTKNDSNLEDNKDVEQKDVETITSKYQEVVQPCLSIEDRKEKYDCLNNLFKEKKDINLCFDEIVKDWKGTCINAVAKSTGDPDLCDRHDSEGLATPCKIYVAAELLDLTICDSLPYDSLTSCYSNIARGSNDYTICGQLKTTSSKESCYWNYGSDKKDVSACNMIQEAVHLKESCLASIN